LKAKGQNLEKKVGKGIQEKKKGAKKTKTRNKKKRSKPVELPAKKGVAK